LWNFLIFFRPTRREIEKIRHDGMALNNAMTTTSLVRKVISERAAERKEGNEGGRSAMDERR